MKRDWVSEDSCSHEPGVNPRDLVPLEGVRLPISMEYSSVANSKLEPGVLLEIEHLPLDFDVPELPQTVTLLLDEAAAERMIESLTITLQRAREDAEYGFREPPAPTDQRKEST